jgi:hypothetical protein
MAQFLLAEGGASITEANQVGGTVWTQLEGRLRSADDDALSSLLKVMVMLGDAPVDFIAMLKPAHAGLATWGPKLRVHLPPYVEQQPPLLTSHCPLPVVLQSIVASYAVPTPEDMWSDWVRWL